MNKDNFLSSLIPCAKSQTQFWPSYLILELTTRCNLRCLMCAINQDPRIQKGGEWYGDLSFEAFENLSKVIPRIRRVDLNGHGESLLIPRFLPILEKVKQYGAYVGITTNGLLMGEDISEAAVRNKMDEVIISIHAASPETYAHLSRNGKLETLIANIKTLNSLKERYRSVLPTIKFNFVGMKNNIGELDTLIRLASDLKVESITILPLAEYDNVKGESLDTNDLIAYIPKALKTAKAYGVILSVPKVYLDQIAIIQPLEPRIAKGGGKPLLQKIKAGFRRLLPKPQAQENDGYLVRDCLDPWDFFFVMQSGRIRPCCVIEENMGNLSTQRFEDIWFGERYQKLRNGILNNTPPAQCTTCINRPFTTLAALRAKVYEKTTSSFRR